MIEDGGHFPLQQITTFEVFYPRIRRGDVFLIEDLHTSYWADYGGRRGQQGTFMEYANALTDQLNAWHSEEPDFQPDKFTRTTASMHFYDSIVVFEKHKVVKPHHEVRGTAESGRKRRAVLLQPRLTRPVAAHASTASGRRRTPAAPPPALGRPSRG